MSLPTPTLVDRLLPLYPVLAELPGALRDDMLAGQAQLVSAQAAQLLFDEGTPCRGFPMLLSGQVRVARGTPNGRSLELYRVGPGELCVASTACLFGHSVLAAHGVAAQATELVVLSPTAFERWTAIEPFRRFVFGIFADRLADLMALAEAVAFQRLDQRLASCLLGRGAVVLGTQQALADELGTVREIVTRLLKRFEQEGWVVIGRERVTVLDPAALRALATG
jgi:CRP/FNR family transcriptional regulator